jgi:hypothetical protein
MRPQPPDKSHPPATEEARPKATCPPSSSAAVVLRFGVRMLILLAFANMGTIGFAKTLESLLAMAAIYCAGVAPLRREAPFGPV